MAIRKEVLNWGEQQLCEAGIKDWKVDAWLLFEVATKQTRAQFFLQNLEEMPQKELAYYQDMIDRRCHRIPLQYITGEQMFMNLSFEVNEQVLIPRMDTEILVLEVEKYLTQTIYAEEEIRVLDLCTGSGCIAISLKKRNPMLSIMGMDISEKALQVAKRNRERLGVQVDFYQSDLFTYFEQLDHRIPLDVVVSNPPYIPSPIIEGLEEEVRDYEPRIALDGTEDGLEYYRRITKESKTHFKKNGMLFYEIGHDQAEAVSEIMEAEGFERIQIVKDLAGLDRVVYGGIKHV